MERVRILLQTRDDDYPSPRSLSVPSTPSGPGRGPDNAPVTRKCPGCNGTGKIRRWRQCPVCEGRKRIEWDSYVGRVAGSEERRPAPMSPEQREAELARLGTSLRLSEGRVDPDESYGWERALQRRNRTGSYRELEQALQVLRAKDPRGLDFLLWIYGSGLNVELSDASKLVEERYIGLLAQRMPARIKLPYHLARDLAERKERLVLALSRDNVAIDEIAEAALLSARSVQRILSGKRQVTKSHIAATITL